MTNEWTPPPAGPPSPAQFQPPEQYPPLPPVPRRRRGVLIGAGLVGAGVAAGAIIGGTVLSTAATPSTTPSSSSSSSSTTPAGTDETDNDANKADRHRSAPVRDDEKAVSASLAAKLKAAALAEVPGGTVYRIETDSGDATYEAHMTKADGTEVTVKFDKTGKVTAVENGMGKGGPHDH